jgi:proteasome lid subunit RPN8/RPN11
VLVLSEPVAVELGRRCAAAYPREACGLVLGRAEPGRRVAARLFEVRNVEPTDPRRGFVLEPAGFLAADVAARLAGLDVVGTFHSHPDTPASPSSADAAGAQPGWSHLIVRVTGVAGPPRADGVRSFVLSDDGLRLDEEPVVRP